MVSGRPHDPHPPTGPRAPGASSGRPCLPRRTHLSPPLPPGGAPLQAATRPSFSPHLPGTSPTLLFRAFPHSGDTHRHPHTPYQKCRLLLRLPAPVEKIRSRALARWRCRLLAEHTVPQRRASQESPERAQPQRHRRGGRSPALLHFRPPGVSQYNPQRSGALEAHPKSSARRPEMTSRDPTWPALRPPRLAQPGEEARGAGEHAQREADACMWGETPGRFTTSTLLTQSQAFGLVTGVWGG